MALQAGILVSFEAGSARCAVSEAVVEQHGDEYVIRPVRPCPNPITVERFNGWNVWLCDQHARQLTEGGGP